MRALFRVLLCTAIASTALAQSQGQSGDSSQSEMDSYATSDSESESNSSGSFESGPIYIERPTQGELVSTDAFTLEWSYDFDYTGDYTVELLPMGATAMGDSVFSTTVFALDSSTVLPGSVLPSLKPSQTAAFSVWVYTDDAYGGRGTYVDQVLLEGAATATATATEAATATVTHTVEVEATPTSDADPGEEALMVETEDEDGGLSTGAKAGIGVGAAAGVLILAAIIGFVLYRRRRRNANKPPKTIREISATGPASVSAVFANPNGGDAPAYTGNGVASELHADSDKRPVSLSLALSPLSETGSVSVSARQSGERERERERYELGS
ncbi:hypothetical protein BDW75DRAFT_243506 [Aspergillus navahoensis]